MDVTINRDAPARFGMNIADVQVVVSAAVGGENLNGVGAEVLTQAWNARIARGAIGDADLLDAFRDGAVLRVRPKAMTVAVILAGLLPILWGAGTGSEVLQRIAGPMVSGMVTAPLLSMFVVPAAYMLIRRRRETNGNKGSVT